MQSKGLINKVRQLHVENTVNSYIFNWLTSRFGIF